MGLTSSKQVQVGPDGPAAKEKGSKLEHYTAEQKASALGQPSNNFIFINVQHVPLNNYAEIKSAADEVVKHPILEIAIKITNANLDELARKSFILRHSREACDLFNERVPFCHKYFGSGEWGNGLLADCCGRNAEVADTLCDDLAAVDQEIAALILAHCPSGKCPLVGMSPHANVHDVKEWFPSIKPVVSHQIVDLQTIWSLAGRWNLDFSAATHHHFGWPTRRSPTMIDQNLKLLAWFREHTFFETHAPPVQDHLGDVPAEHITGKRRPDNCKPVPYDEPKA